MAKLIVFDEIITLLSSENDATLSEEMNAYLYKLGSKGNSRIESCYDLNNILPMLVKCCENNPNKTDIILKLFPYIYEINNKTGKGRLQFDLWDGATCASLLFLIRKSNSMRASGAKPGKVQLCILLNIFDSLLHSMGPGKSNVEFTFNCDILSQLIHLLEADSIDLLLNNGVDNERLFNNAKQFIDPTCHNPKDRRTYEILMPLIENITKKIIINTPKTDEDEILRIYTLLHQFWLDNGREDKYLKWIISYMKVNKHSRALTSHAVIKNLTTYSVGINTELALQKSVWEMLESMISRNSDKEFVFDILFEKWLENQNDSQYILLLIGFVCENGNNINLVKFIGIYGLIEFYRCIHVNKEHKDTLFNLINKMMAEYDDAYELQTTLPYKSYFVSNYQEIDVLSQSIAK